MFTSCDPELRDQLIREAREELWNIALRTSDPEIRRLRIQAYLEVSALDEIEDDEPEAA